MTLYNGTVNQLVQGVSQQHPKDRAEGQLEEQVNCISDVVDGLCRRPAFKTLAELTDITTNFTLDDKTAIHYYDRGDGSERYIILFDTSGRLKIYDTNDGSPISVTNNAQSALASATPIQDLRFHTIGDTTFCLNTATEVAMSPATTDSLPYEALIYVRKASYGRTYDVYINEVVRATHTTDSVVTISSGQVHKVQSPQTEVVAEDLYDQLVTWGGFSSISIAGDAIHVQMTGDFDISIDDGNHRNDIYVIKHQVKEWAELPKYAPDGYKVQVTGFDNSQINNYWLKWVSENGPGSGYGSNILYGADSSFSSPNNWLLWTGGTQYSSYAHCTNGANNYILAKNIDYNFVGGTVYKVQILFNSPPSNSKIQVGYWTPDFSIGDWVEFDDSEAGSTATGYFQMNYSGVIMIRVIPDTGTWGEDAASINIDDLKIFPSLGNDTWNGPGSWQETVAPDVEYALDADTMPIELTRQSNGTFIAATAEWLTRDVGDSETNPNPSFIGNTVSAIGSYQNRLALLSGENVCMSVSADRRNFFANSVAQESSEDPIDSSSSDNQVTPLKHMVIFDKSLVVFSPNAQFIHPGEIPVEPGTFAVQSDSNFETDAVISPVSTGTSIMFPSKHGNYVKMWEYQIADITGKPRCDTISKHIPKFLPGNPRQFSADATTDYAFISTDDDTSALYVVQWYYHMGERRQLAWHKFELGSSEVLRLFAQFGNKLYAIIERDSSVFLEELDLTRPVTDNAPFEIHLDHYSTVSNTAGSYTVGLKSYNQRFTVGDSLSGLTVVQGNGCTDPGFELTSAQYYYDGSNYLYTNITGASTGTAYLIIGSNYSSYGTFTNPYVKDGNGRPLTKFETIINDINVIVNKTAYLTVTVDRAVGTDFEHTFNGLKVTDYRTKIGEITLFDTDITVPVYDLREMVALKFSTDTHLPFSINSFDWEVQMNGRGRRSL